MSLIDNDSRAAMRDSFARLLVDSCTEPDVRRIMASDNAHDPALWQEISRLGVLATLVPEEFGGLGGGPLEAEILMEEAGAVLLPGPFFSSAILATALLAQSDDAEAKGRLLPALAEGRVIGTAALAGEKGLWNGEDGEVKADADGTLSGAASYVSDGALADLLLVVAGTGADRQLYEVTDRGDVSITPLKSFDLTQPLARVAQAGREAGAARRNFDFTVEYLRTRIQFGRPIGGFQAIKHMAADLLVEKESAITGARVAAERLAEATPDAEELVAMASFAVSEAQFRIAFDSIQMHGGIGFTWEHPAHLYLRRARHDQMFLGSNAQARERFITILEKVA